MPLLKPCTKKEKKQIRVYIEEDLLKQIHAYCEWANLKDESEFFEQAANFVMSKDSEWKKSIKKA